MINRNLRTELNMMQPTLALMSFLEHMLTLLILLVSFKKMTKIIYFQYNSNHMLV